MPSKPQLIGPGGQLYAEKQPGSDETKFRVDNTSDAYYQSPYFKLHKSQVQPIPPSRPGALLQMRLDDFVDTASINAIRANGKIAFHAVGDTGAAKVNPQQTVARALAQQATVADAMVGDVEAGGPEAPAFFFHLGDIVYSFGESQYYYDQFYEPYRAYDRPIFAIPGNHDGMVFGSLPNAPQVPSLHGFLRNFCAGSAGPSPDAGGMVRSAMTQPGVYFTLDAPFVSIIGLYSNVLDGPGVMSSQGGHFPLGDEQLVFLKSELERLRPMRLAGERAIIVALHHPPLSADAHHGGSTGLQQDLDGACRAAGFWPDMILSGHAHLYQRFTMRPAGVSQEIPYIVSGCGGYAATPPVQKLGPAPITISDSSGQHTLECDPLVKFGYLLVTCDGKTLSSTFRAPANHGTVADLDTVSVDLATRKIRVTAKGKGGAPKPKTLPRKSPKKTPPAPAAALRGRSRSAASSVAAKVSRQP